MTTSKSRPIEIPAAEANRRFSELLRGVKEEGKTFTITSHGRPVAEIAPSRESENEALARAEKEKAWKSFLADLEARPVLNLPKFTRDDFYD